MARGGKRPGAGRPKGSKENAVAPFLPVINGITPLQFFQLVYQAPEAPLAARMEAAKAAAPFMHPKLAPKKAEEEDEIPVGEEAEWEDMLGSRPN